MHAVPQAGKSRQQWQGLSLARCGDSVNGFLITCDALVPERVYPTESLAAHSLAPVAHAKPRQRMRDLDASTPC